MNADSTTKAPPRVPIEKKATSVLVLTVMLSGCSIFTQPPSEEKARRLEDRRLSIERGSHVQADAKNFKDRGLTGREAHSLAEAQR